MKKRIWTPAQRADASKRMSDPKFQRKLAAIRRSKRIAERDAAVKAGKGSPEWTPERRAAHSKAMKKSYNERNRANNSASSSLEFDHDDDDIQRDFGLDTRKKSKPAPRHTEPLHRRVLEHESLCFAIEKLYNLIDDEDVQKNLLVKLILS